MTSRITATELRIPGLFLLQRNLLKDQRGYLERLFCEEELASILLGRTIKQINHTFTRNKGAVRGLHFQFPPYSETKFVSCIKGEVFDVAVDLRQKSQTFLSWHGEILSAENHRTLMIPEGFAHGFQTLTEDCEMLYLHTNFYQPASEAGLNAVDPKLDIAWPLPISEQSERDEAHPFYTPSFVGIAI